MGFFVKKWTFPQRRVHYVQYQYFYFTFYLLGGGVRTQRTLLTGLIQSRRCLGLSIDICCRADYQLSTEERGNVPTHQTSN